MSISVLDVKEAVEQFPNTKFYSMGLKPKKVIVESANGGLYEIGYIKTKTGFSFDTHKATLLKEPEETPVLESADPYANNMNMVHTALSQIFTEDYDTAIKELKQVISSIPNAERTSPASSFNESEEALISEYKGIVKSLESKIAEFEAIEAEFKNSFNIFNEDGSIVADKIVSIDEQEKVAEASKQYYEAFKSCIELNHIFNKYLIETFGDDVHKMISESLDFADKPGVAIPKLAAKLKREGKSINTVDFIKTMNEALTSYNSKQAEFFEDIDPSMANHIIPNFVTDSNQPKFLRFNVGIFTPVDLMTLSNELSQAMSCLGSITPEDLQMINNWKNQIEYMSRYNQICDRMVVEIIKTFNDRFGTDNTADFENPDEQMGFNSTEQMTKNMAQGFATSNPSEPASPVNPNLAGIELVLDDDDKK